MPRENNVQIAIKDPNMTTIRKYFDLGSLLIIIITFVLFLAALYFTGLTHDILLETGVFLVSVKLIVMSYKNKVLSDELREELAEIKALILKMDKKSDV